MVSDQAARLGGSVIFAEVAGHPPPDDRGPCRRKAPRRRSSSIPVTPGRGDQGFKEAWGSKGVDMSLTVKGHSGPKSSVPATTQNAGAGRRFRSHPFANRSDVVAQDVVLLHPTGTASCAIRSTPGQRGRWLKRVRSSVARIASRSAAIRASSSVTKPAPASAAPVPGSAGGNIGPFAQQHRAAHPVSSVRGHYLASHND